jgi:8-oxo-dGTP pyrophosphatase MutT (NUDIX family)
MKKPPQIKLTFIHDAQNAKPFIKSVRNKYRLDYPDGSSSEMILDTVVRTCPDAVVIIPISLSSHNNDMVWLRSSIRPAAAIRAITDKAFEYSGNLWELPAGIIDPGESAKEAAKRECFEEVGFNAPLDSFKHIHTVLTMPALLAEKLHFFIVDVGHLKQTEPSLDGSPLEKGGELVCLTLSELEHELNIGNIPDIKTNLGLRLVKDFLTKRNLK